MICARVSHSNSTVCLLIWFSLHKFVCVCVCVVCQWDVLQACWWYERPVWQSSPPLFLSSPTSSPAYISSINPVLGGLLWSLCVLWAMVIICLLRLHCFMCLVCTLPPCRPFSLSYSHFIWLTHSCCLCFFSFFFLVFCIKVQSLSLPPPRLLRYDTSFFLISPFASFTFGPKLRVIFLSFVSYVNNSLIYEAAKKPALGSLLM